MLKLTKKILQNKKVLVYSLLFVIILLANVFMFFKNFSDSNFNGQALSTPAAEEGTTQLKKQSYQVRSVLENNLFNTLKKIGDWPVKPEGQIGKPDPFIPFFTNR